MQNSPAIKPLMETLAHSDVSFDSDRAVTDFRAFEPIAMLHAERVDNSAALEIIEVIVDGIKNALQCRRKALRVL